MKSVEFLHYKPYPNDQYLMGIATIRVRVAIGPDRVEKLILRFKHVRLKTGGDFYTSGSHAFTENGVKGYADVAGFDSRATSDELQDFLREKVREEMSMHSAVVSPSTSTNSVNYNPANPLNINGISAPAAKAGSSSQYDLPF